MNLTNRTSWTAMPGFLLLIPVTLPDKTESGIFVPDSATVKVNSGICFAIGHHPMDDKPQNELDKHFIGKEVFFNRLDEYKVVDSDTSELLYILHHSKVIMWREARATPTFFPVAKAVKLPSPLQPTGVITD